MFARFAVGAQVRRNVRAVCITTLQRSLQPFPHFSSYPRGSVSSYKANVHISEYSCSCRCCGCSQPAPAISRESFHLVSFLYLFSPVKIFPPYSNSITNEWEGNCHFKPTVPNINLQRQFHIFVGYVTECIPIFVSLSNLFP